MDPVRDRFSLFPVIPRIALPAGHPVRKQAGLESVAVKVNIQRATPVLDTPENRFIKFALEDIRRFLRSSEETYQSEDGWQSGVGISPKDSAQRLTVFCRGVFFRGIGRMRFLPLGSTVLQRKEGYREVLHLWLRFHASVQIDWEAGRDLFGAGQKDVATLYEYWVFFELYDLFCSMFNAEGGRTGVEKIIDADKKSVRLKSGKEIVFKGSHNLYGRSLAVEFSYNKSFKHSGDWNDEGSWTRLLHPDYTFTFWPRSAGDAKTAERLNLLVHIHFDAKYRVNKIGLLGGEDEAGDEAGKNGNYKRQDLLKMHAYKDAIKRLSRCLRDLSGQRFENCPCSFSRVAYW